MKFKIKKGKHYHSNLLQRFNLLNLKKKMSYEVVFDSNCIYPFENIDSKDLNKLFGMGYYDNHYTSGRIVWCPNFNEQNPRINLYAYVYEMGKRLPHKHIATIKTGERAYLSVEKKDGFYRFIANGYIADIKCERPKGFIRQFPYFGGDNKAPQDMTLTMRKV